MKRCNIHFSDLTSCTGVCASCLHDRLIPIAVAQLQSPAAPINDRRIVDTIPPPLLPPHSVSPYVARRKLDNAAVSHCGIVDQLFYSTPQVGSTGGGSNYKKSKWTLLSNFFKSASWLSSSAANRRRKQSQLFSVDELNSGVAQRNCGDRGLSPEKGVNYGIESEFADGVVGEVTEGWKETPKRAARRAGRRNVPGMVLCLSPLVRASPNRYWNQKGGILPEMAVTGESRGTVVKPHIACVSSYGANRSRKIADFGRFNPSR